MTNKEQAVLLANTWDVCLQALPESIRNVVYVVDKTPNILKKCGDDIQMLRLRIHPKNKHTPKFWSKEWCFYQLDIGEYGEYNTLGTVGFIQAPQQIRTGSGQYYEPVVNILNELSKSAVSQYKLLDMKKRMDGRPYTQYQIKYKWPEFKHWPVEMAGNDLAWLISNTILKFQNISPIENNIEAYEK